MHTVRNCTVPRIWSVNLHLNQEHVRQVTFPISFPGQIDGTPLILIRLEISSTAAVDPDALVLLVVFGYMDATNPYISR